MRRVPALGVASLGCAIVTSLAMMVLTGAAAGKHAEDGFEVGSFSHGTLAGWVRRSFKGETEYQLVADPELGATVLAATADGSASGRFRKIRVDLTKTRYLNWSWKVTNIFPGIDETQKAGDDFAARLYVVVERGLMGTASLALNYVWSSHHPVEQWWASPYSSQVILLAANSGSDRLGTWVRHTRDLRSDLRLVFGEEIAAIDAVAVMTDTDNTLGKARAYYGDIWFSAQ